MAEYARGSYTVYGIKYHIVEAVQTRPVYKPDFRMACDILP
jgi:hypothetical protein